jgi:16S rRNA (uracil1498-N3)-methyltransferase
MSAHTFSFYLPGLGADDTTVSITGDEHAHLKRVLRLRAGETIRITNGRGLAASAAIQAVGDSATLVRVTAVESGSPPARRLVLALPLLQRAHFDAAVAQCVEVGVSEFVPVAAEKCHVRAWTPALATRATRVAVSAMKQSGRNWLPPVRPALDVGQLAATFAEYETVVLADAGGDAPACAIARGDTLAIVGPEAGFSDREVDRLLAAGARRVTISRHRLRAETAATVLVALLALPG